MVAIFIKLVLLYRQGNTELKSLSNNRKEISMNTITLNQSWLLHEAPLNYGATDLQKVKSFDKEWMECQLPSDVRIPLMQYGKIKDPTLSDYCLDAEWVENRSWWFLKKFHLTTEDLRHDIAELKIDRLDTKSDIFVNGVYIGSHNDVHYPFLYNVLDHLQEGENELAIRVSTGLEDVTDEQMSEVNWATCTEYDNGGKYRGDRRRAFVRRPQYTVGWDWNPKVVTCGIGNVTLHCYCGIAIREVSVQVESIEDPALLNVMVNIENLDIIGTRECDLHIEISHDGKPVSEQIIKDQLLCSGYNYITSHVSVDDPKLWWPSGYGEQPLYDIRVYAVSDHQQEEWPVFAFGIRTVTLDLSKIDETNRKFTLIVNNTPVFAKGGDWIPADTIYSRVTDEKLDTLLNEAKEANFNFLRIWGGGLYEVDHFYDMCDRLGLMLWHDFMFACTTYPDHQEWFRNLVAKELDHQTKRLRNHACIALFCGTNENHWLFNKIDTPKWNIDITYNHQYGLYVPNVMAREAMQKNCPFIPYWNSSPYGGGLPNDDTIGDVHIWRNAFMSSDMEERIDLRAYDRVESKFVSEYGYVGPCCIESIRSYLDLKENEDIVREGRPWEMHLNVFEKETVYAGIERFYADHPEALSIEDYILYGGMVHNNVLGYSLEAIRFKENCSGGIFWMYNDAWGEVGWTIIDYFLRRKAGFYGVKRALAHQKLTMRNVNGELIIQGNNDTPCTKKFDAEFGYVSFDGSERKTRTLSIELAPRTRSYILKEKMPEFDSKKGSIVLIPEDKDLDPVMLFVLENRFLDYTSTPVQVSSRQQDTSTVLTISSPVYAHGVYIEGIYNCSDNYFDILPGEEKTIVVENPNADTLTVKQIR